MSSRIFGCHIFVVLYKSFYAIKIIGSVFGDPIVVECDNSWWYLRFGTGNTTMPCYIYKELDEILVREHFTTRGLIFGFLWCRIHFANDLVQTKRRLERV